MFVVPSENILCTSDIDLTQQSNKCYIRYNSAVSDYLFCYKVLLTKLPNDIVKIIMSKLDPRNDVHIFGLCSGKVSRGKDYITFNTCTRCFLKIIEQNTSQRSQLRETLHAT
jgi:hypothetical protein